MNQASEMRVGLGWDIHRLAEGRKLILGSVAIDHPCGLLGHSDGDVVLHALADAVFGAAGQGDIGDYFPDTDEANRGIDSRKILARAIEEARKAGFAVSNADLVIMAEEPKLAPHKAKIRQALAEALGCRPDAVGLKAKTAETIGAVGQGKAIACQAVVLLKALAKD
ncbi:MAG: 2-C-methyl-D-erythritol 2,4-cyclodiphosphate synthase [Phycisphaerae bacterium]|jgi:2-C-methyl-D-erythritol 2,4-cyclodiphosphate synthase|nr:2-C-methyl-D-erythritol 2,4-cyclodiphosphate synthase [Phycisphaerae bacterium]